MKLILEQIDSFLLEARIDNHIAQLPSGYEDKLYQFGDLEPKYMDWVFIQIRRKLKKARNEQEVAKIMDDVVDDLYVGLLLSSIEDFDKLVKHKVLKGKDTDILRYSDDDLIQLMIVDHSKTIRKINLDNKHKSRLKNIPKEIVVYEDSNYIAYKVPTMAAACDLPHGDWCISTKSVNNEFDKYKKLYDNIYFIHYKNENPDLNNTVAMLIKKTLTGYDLHIVSKGNTPFYFTFDNNGKEVVQDSHINRRFSADFAYANLAMSLNPFLAILKFEGIIDKSDREEDYL